MKLRKIVISPVNQQNFDHPSLGYDDQLSGCVHVETYTKAATSCGDNKTLVIFAFFPDDDKST